MIANKYKILVVEDEDNINNLLKALLETNGYQVITAKNCQNGHTLFTSHRPDLVILDLGLPDCDGMTFLKQIRQDSLTPVIVVSARSEDMDMLMNCNKKISIREVSESLNITRCYLRDLFIKYEGIPPKVYLNEVKLSCAKELLMNPEFSVSLVAKSTGFDDVIAFSRFFKQHTGVSPSEYRKA